MLRAPPRLRLSGGSCLNLSAVPMAKLLSNKESGGDSVERNTVCPGEISPKMHKGNFLNFSWVHPSRGVGGQE